MTKAWITAASVTVLLVTASYLVARKRFDVINYFHESQSNLVEGCCYSSSYLAAIILASLLEMLLLACDLSTRDGNGGTTG